MTRASPTGSDPLPCVKRGGITHTHALTHQHTRTHTSTHPPARTHARAHARTHARTHARMRTHGPVTARGPPAEPGSSPRCRAKGRPRRAQEGCRYSSGCTRTRGDGWVRAWVARWRAQRLLLAYGRVGGWLVSLPSLPTILREDVRAVRFVRVDETRERG